MAVFSFLQKRNNAGTTLAAAVAPGDATVTVSAAGALPLTTPFLITVYRTLPTDGTMEIMRVTNIVGDVLTVTRAQEGTAAVAHGSDDAVWSYPTAASWEELQDAINAVADDYVRRDGTLDLTGDWMIAANDVTLTAGRITAATGEVGHLGVGIAPVSTKGINLNENVLDTASGYHSAYLAFIKTAGGSNHNDVMRGLYLRAGMDQAAGEIGHLQGVVIQLSVDAGNVGDATHNRDALPAYLVAQLNGGKVWGDAYGAHVWLDQAAPNEVTGDVYALHVEADLDGTVGGTAYMCYLKEDDGVDFGFYQDGSAANLLGGTLLILDKVMFTQVDGEEYIDSLGDGYMDYRATTAHRFGDGANQLVVSAAGVLTLEGTAKRVLTLRPEVNVDEVKKQTVPVQTQVGVFFGYIMPIWNTDHQELYFRQNVPGRWDEASDVTAHFLVCLADAEDVGDHFRFQLSWNHTQPDEPVPAATHDVTDEITILAGRSAQYDVYQLDFTIDYDANGVGNEMVAHDLLAARLRRVDATDPDVTNNIIVLDWHFDYVVDKMFKST